MPNYRLRIGGEPGPVSWSIPNNDTLYSGRNLTVELATGIPSGAVYSASPDLLPGQTLELDGATLNLVGDSTVPTVDDSVPGSVEDTISARDVVIEVMDTVQAVATILRTGEQFGAGQSGSNANIQYAMQRMQDGDTLEVSPGSIFIPGNGDGSTYLEGGCFHVWKSCTIRGISGRGRWRLAPSSEAYIDGRSGIVIREPNQTYSDVGDTSTSNQNKTIVISDFDFDNWGRNADDSGVKIRSNTATAWTGYHSSITFSNFKLGKLPFHPSASGFGGAAENLIFTDGLVFDTGDGINAAPGNDHNFYLTARNLTMRGIRAIRTRSAEYPFNQANTLDGHILKASFNNADIQGCVFDCGPEGDSSILVQCKGGGNLVLRGCLLISGVNSQTATGAVVFEKEANNFGGWMYGLEGHSLLIEKNVFINHRPYVASTDQRAMVYFRPSGHSWEVVPGDITSCVIRDNIGMSTVPDSLWVQNAPPVFSGAVWTDANSVMTYGAGEPGFSDADKLLKRYRREAGTIAASGSVATYRFIWPHGSQARTDAYRGLA